MYPLFVLACTLLVSPAAAQDLEDLPDGPGSQPTAPSSTTEPPRPETGYRFDGVAPSTRDRRNFDMEFGFRTRMVSVPDSILDIWYFDDDNENWAYIEGRPNLTGFALGLEWVIKSDNSNGIFYAEFIDSLVGAGYWDDIEEPADHLDGDFLAPTSGFGLVTTGANYAYEAHLVRIRDTQGRFGLSFLAGGGLGLAVMTGRMDRWVPDQDGNPSYKLFLDGADPTEDKNLPPVYPMVDINAGLRFNFGDRVVIRAEGGLHTLLYYGLSAGVQI